MIPNNAARGPGACSVVGRLVVGVVRLVLVVDKHQSSVSAPCQWQGTQQQSAQR